jgi:isocitrate/isopropylmalate dehydrogenase
VAHSVVLIAGDGTGPELTQATRRVLSVTYDLKPNRDDPTAVGTSEVADAVIEKLEAEVAV